jgi:hypothetical protein
MTAMPSHPERTFHGAAWIVPALWAMVLCAATFEVAWGPAAGLCMANDDLKFVRMPARELPLWDAIADAWRTQPSFRPLEIAMAHVSDPVALVCPWVPPVQGAGLCALMLATLALARRALPGVRALWPATLLLVLLSPATTASVWQMDSCSQTWSAALGAWGTWLAWRWIDAPAQGARPWWALGTLCALMAFGLTVKENFYGWALGLTVASVGIAVVRARHDWASACRALWVLVPLAVVPMAHLACRWQWSALSGLVSGTGDGTRYKAEFGMNLLVNAAVSLAGAVGLGPFHLVLDGEAPSALRLLPVAATGLVVAAILIALGAVALDAKSVRGVRWTALGFVSCASVLSLSATIPMASVSELYGLGANVGCAMLAAAGIAALWRSGDVSRRAIARACVVVGAVVAGGIGSYGLASRALHFGVVWDTVRTLNDAIVSLQPTLAPRRAGDPSAAGMVHVPTVCLVGGTHSQYVMPPLQSLDLNLTEAWLARRDPSRRIVFSIGTSPQSPRPHEIVLDCASLPQHGHW